VLNRVDLEHNSYYYSRYYRPEYGGYYGAPPTGSASVGQPGTGNGAQEPGVTSRAARVATAVASLAAAFGVRLKSAEHFRIERHL